MKWIAGVSTLVAFVAIAALLVVFRIGLAQPPKFEDMTIDDTNAPSYSAGMNAHIEIINCTGRELSICALLDHSVSFGGAIIRDDHFGSIDMSVTLVPGTHTLSLMTAGRPWHTNSLDFTTTAGMTNFVYVGVWRRGTNYDYKLKQSFMPRSIM
jgi:hypothetical protein